MARSSILGGDTAASYASGKDVDSLGPSDSSDSGSDVQGERVMPTRPGRADELGAVPVDLASDSDSVGTGERASADGNDGPDGADILPDRIVDTPDGDLGDDEMDALADLDEFATAAGPGERNRDVEQLEGDDEDENGDPPENPSDDEGPDPGNNVSGRHADRVRQTLNGSRAV